MTAEDIAASLGDLLRRYKTRERIATPELAARLGVSKSMADRLLQDRLPDPSVALADQIATLISVDLPVIAAACRISRDVRQKELVEAS